MSLNQQRRKPREAMEEAWNWKVVLACVTLGAVMAPGASLAADSPDGVRAANQHYAVNREPLRQTAFVRLPPGAVRP